MSGNNVPSQRRMLGADIGLLGREELITLARAVCGQAASFSGGHGNIHPENIFVSADGSPWLGGRADHAPGEWTTDELEYMAPELFWSGTLSARADVYSIGLMLYAGVTRGRLPFFACAANEMTNEKRAAALRRRMNGETVPIPTIAGEKLGEVLKKCLAFAPEERYSDTIELSMALEPCVGEGDAAAMAMFGKSESELSEVERTMAGILASYSAEEIAAIPDPEPAPPVSEPEPQPEPEPEEKLPPELQSVIYQGKRAIADIRRLNDEIPDERISAQIDLIERLTAQIFDCVRKNPKKLSQIRQFLNYYLPTTIKLMEQYVTLQNQSLKTENITEGMQKIEDLLDKVIIAFQRQLDALFEADVVDITADIRVMEQMMASEGLTNKKDFA